MSTQHRDLVSADLHKPGFVQATDPGVVGPGRLWVDTSGGTGAWVLRIRNDADSAWEEVITKSTSVSLYNPDTSSYVTWKCRNNVDGLPELYPVD